MASGSVRFFDASRGFGFIHPDDNSKDVFVHVSALARSGLATLGENQKVSYDLETDKGKSFAVNLKLL